MELWYVNNSHGILCLDQDALIPDENIATNICRTTDYYNKSDIDNSLDLFLKKDGSVALTGDFNANNHTIDGIIDPVSDQQVATKKYVDQTVASSSGSSIQFIDYDINTNTPDLTISSAKDSGKFYIAINSGTISGSILNSSDDMGLLVGNIFYFDTNSNNWIRFNGLLNSSTIMYDGNRSNISGLVITLNDMIGSYNSFIGDPHLQSLSMCNSRITELATPIAPGDAFSLQHLNSVINQYPTLYVKLH